MKNERKRKMMEYLDALDGVSEQLVFALKHCVKLLGELQPPGENKANWKKMLNDLEDIAGLSDNIVQKRQELFC